MGTRADFYVGTGKSAEWIGSVAWDGCEWHENPDCPIMQTKTEQEFRDMVSAELSGRDDATTPILGWPWPWNDSCTTDYSYCFSDGAVIPFSWGAEITDGEETEAVDWPDMGGEASAQAGNKRSGILVVSV